MEHAEAYDDFIMAWHNVRCEIAAQRLQLALRALADSLERRYSPDQPRTPAGNPDGGRWTGLAEAAALRVSRAIATGSTDGADIASDLEELGGGTPILRPTSKGAPQFFFPNGMILRSIATSNKPRRKNGI